MTLLILIFIMMAFLPVFSQITKKARLPGYLDITIQVWGM